LLADARAAARDGRLTEAVDRYRAAIQAYPYSYNAFGELGNIQYSQGRSTEAASSYYQAGVQLLAAGYVREAERLQRLIQPLDAALANSLETKLMLHRLKR
jgi:tetratricopeptide (TPR) repeat protein